MKFAIWPGGAWGEVEDADPPGQTVCVVLSVAPRSAAGA